jgi:diaminohydroxyphosphoribosylaminopyrimidine deaminase/5-amino-6-(5-phosphoribosylamino)uracil reductase
VIEKLKAAGVEVVINVLEEECNLLNKRFFTFHTKHRPYIILKWAETANGKISPPLPPEGGSQTRLLISNDYTNRLVHKWRSEEAAIMVGTNTALLDNPSLNNRYWSGANPIRLIVDMHLRLPSSLHIFNQQQKTIIFNIKQHKELENLLYYQVTDDVNMVHQIVHACYQMNIQSILIEGGKQLLQSFIDEGLWDETRVIRNEELIVDDGLNAPQLLHYTQAKTETIASDVIRYYSNTNL